MPDSFYGGKEDLTLALGYEEDGITTIVFRRKLEGLFFRHCNDSHTFESVNSHFKQYLVLTFLPFLSNSNLGSNENCLEESLALALPVLLTRFSMLDNCTK